MDLSTTDHPSRTTPDFGGPGFCSHCARQRLEDRITQLAAHIAAASAVTRIARPKNETSRVDMMRHGTAPAL